ncbi:MAG TPA: hypothetical protein V6C84_16095 [Coleofasciculaceae cyanobacterium]|jgi:hypothetical protein
MKTFDSAVAKALITAELYAKEMLPNPDYDDGGQNKADFPLTMTMIDFVVGSHETTNLDAMRHYAFILIGLLGQVAMEMSATWLVDEQQQDKIAQGLVSNAATELDMKLGDNATGLRSQLCIHFSKRVGGVNLQSSLMHCYSTALHPANAIVRVLSSLSGNFANDVD